MTLPILDQEVVISNKEFLQGIFGDQWERAYVCAFRTVVDHAAPSDWLGSHAGARLGDWYGSLEDGEANQYFTVSLFEDLAGQAVRSKRMFEAQYVLVIDDLGAPDAAGAKASMELLVGKIEPTYILETSLQNYQAAYKFTVGAGVDMDLMDRLSNSMVKDGLGLEVDPGMKNVTRLVRLPRGINNKEKYGEVWQCKLRTWHPELVYEVSDIVESWGLNLGVPKAQNDPGEYAAAGGSNFTWELLNRLGLVGREQADGYFHTPCPNEAAHTVIDGRHGYNPNSGYKCFHGSCTHLGAKDLTEWLKDKYRVEWDALRAEMYPPEDWSVEDMFPPVASVEGVEQLVMPPTTKERLEELVTQAKRLTDTDGLQDEAGQIALEAAALGDTMALERVLKIISGTGLISKTALEKYIKEKRGKKRQKPGGEGEGPCGELARKYVFCKPDGRFYDVGTKVSMCVQAFNITEKGDATMEGEALPATHTFGEQNGICVDGLMWEPCPMNEPGDLLVYHQGKTMLNTYEPPGYLEPHGDGGKLGPWWELVTHILPDEAERRAVLQHFAATIQQPQRKIDWQILLQGGMGIGKDALLKPLTRYFGSAAIELSKEELSAGWGDMRAGRKLLIFSEVWRPGDRQFANSIKTMAASTSTGIETLNIKGGGVRFQRSLAAIVAMSNHADALHLEKGERRWFVVSAFDVPPLEQRFYNTYHQWLDSGGWQAVVSWLMAVDLGSFSWGRLPFHTEAMDALREAGRTTEVQYLSDLLKAREFPFHDELISLGQVEAFLLTDTMFSGGRKGLNRQILKKDLEEIGCLPVKKRGRRRGTKNGKKVEHKTPVLYTLDDPTRFNEMSHPELYDYCPAELFINSRKKFDANGEFIEDQNSEETKH